MSKKIDFEGLFDSIPCTTVLIKKADATSDINFLVTAPDGNRFGLGLTKMINDIIKKEVDDAVAIAMAHNNGDKPKEETNKASTTKTTPQDDRKRPARNTKSNVTPVGSPEEMFNAANPIAVNSETDDDKEDEDGYMSPTTDQPPEKRVKFTTPLDEFYADYEASGIKTLFPNCPERKKEPTGDARVAFIASTTEAAKQRYRDLTVEFEEEYKKAKPSVDEIVCIRLIFADIYARKSRRTIRAIVTQNIADDFRDFIGSSSSPLVKQWSDKLNNTIKLVRAQLNNEASRLEENARQTRSGGRHT